MYERFLAFRNGDRLSLTFAACLFLSTADPAKAAAPDTRRIATVSGGVSHTDRSLRRLPFDLTETDVRNFELVMRKISAAGRVAIVAEGVPLRAELTKAEGNALRSALSTAPDAAAATTLALVAQAYDYDVERASDSGYILRKHHSDPVDLPDVTFDEITRSLDSLLQLIDGDRSIPAVTGFETASFLLYDSLSDSQKAIAKADKGLILTMADLGPEQKKLAAELARNITVDSKTSALRRCSRHLRAIHEQDPYFRWSSKPTGMSLAFPLPLTSNPLPPQKVDCPFFVYGFPAGRTRHLSEFPLNNQYKINIDGGGMQPAADTIAQMCTIPPRQDADIVSSEQGPASGAIAGGGPTPRKSRRGYDPSAPTSQDRMLAPGMMSNRLASTVTLATLADLLSAKNTMQVPGAGLHIAIDRAVEGKPVTVYGRQYIQGDALFRFAAKVYGLQLSAAASDNHSIYVTTPGVRGVHSVSDLQAEIQSLIPPSLMRSLESQIDRIAGRTKLFARVSNSDISEQERRAEEKFESGTRSAAAVVAADCAYFPADRRLLVLGTTAVPTPDAPPVPVASLGSEPSRLLALMLLTDGPLVAMRDLLHFDPPSCVTDPTALQILVRCGEDRNGQGIDIRIHSLERTGDSKYEGQSIFMRHADMIPWPGAIQPGG